MDTACVSFRFLFRQAYILIFFIATLLFAFKLITYFLNFSTEFNLFATESKITSNNISLRRGEFSTPVPKFQATSNYGPNQILLHRRRTNRWHDLKVSRDALYAGPETEPVPPLSFLLLDDQYYITSYWVVLKLNTLLLSKFYLSDLCIFGYKNIQN